MLKDSALAEAVGRLLVVGYEGVAFRPELEMLLLKIRPAGLILFSRNIPQDPAAKALADREALKAVLEQSRDLARAEFGRPLLIAVDQEGGSVRRVGPPFSLRPSQRTAALEETPEITRNLTKRAAGELAQVGFNFNLAPVVDLAAESASKFIQSRSFGADPETASRYGLAVLEGQRAGGLLSCAKHFPGLGDVVIDPHEDLAELPHSRARLEKIEFQPFRALIAAELDAVMTSHVLVPALDPDRPATFSSLIVEILRKELSFKGALLTDDLEMGAVVKKHGLGWAAVEAIKSGHDLALICRRGHYISQAQEALAQALLKGQLTGARLEEADERLRGLWAGLN